jgi:hypothetical protein
MSWGVGREILVRSFRSESFTRFGTKSRMRLARLPPGEGEVVCTSAVIARA